MNLDKDSIGIICGIEGDIYRGEIKFNDMYGLQKDGTGMIMYPNGDIYGGEWKNERRNGRGIYIAKDETRYEGEWKDNKPNGFGVAIRPNGEKYKGEWTNGIKNGSMIYTDPNGNTRCQKFKNNKIIKDYCDMTTYENKFENDNVYYSQLKDFINESRNIINLEFNNLPERHNVH